MIDYSNLADSAINNQVFFGNAAGTNDWYTWNKPKNCKYVYILAIGSGSGGGAGRRSTSNAASGGGGGASGGITKGFFQADVLPDVLYVQVGSGGFGGTGASIQANGGAGGPGKITYVAVGPNTGTAYIVMQSGTVAATAGPGGTLSAVSGGVGETEWGLTGAFGNIGQMSSEPGQNGGNGTLNTTNGGSITLTKFVSGGAGGGGTSASTSVSSGGNITGAGIVPTILGLPGVSVPASIYIGPDGRAGYQTRMPGNSYTNRDPLIFTGGAGAGGIVMNSGTGYGSPGGNASIGSGGGGGGGANFSNATFLKAGNGGCGGDGLVIITCF
jgi:hypothetical protein